jgi:hypothetical protein
MKNSKNAARTTKRRKPPIEPAEDTRTVKEIMQGLVERLPPDCAWEDVAYTVYVCEKIAEGLRAEQERRLLTEEEIYRELGL